MSKAFVNDKIHGTCLSFLSPSPFFYKYYFKIKLLKINIKFYFYIKLLFSKTEYLKSKFI